MTSQEWKKLNPERFKMHQRNYRMRNRKPCRLCGEKMPYPSMGQKYCIECQPKARRLWAKRLRDNAVIIFHKYKERIGCKVCGYNKFGGALDFDHKDPSTKKRRILAKDWVSRKTRPIVLAELKKCQLLCANCHREKTFRQDIVTAIGPRPSTEHTIDRINNDGHYSLDNIRWATMKLQNNNRRKPCQTL